MEALYPEMRRREAQMVIDYDRVTTGRLTKRDIGSTETKHFIYFYLGHCAILLFKTQ